MLQKQGLCGAEPPCSLLLYQLVSLSRSLVLVLNIRLTRAGRGGAVGRRPGRRPSCRASRAARGRRRPPSRRPRSATRSSSSSAAAATENSGSAAASTAATSAAAGSRTPSPAATRRPSPGRGRTHCKGGLCFKFGAQLKPRFYEVMFTTLQSLM